MDDAVCATGRRAIIALSEKLHLSCPSPLPLCFLSASFVHHAQSLYLKCCSHELSFTLFSVCSSPWAISFSSAASVLCRHSSNSHPGVQMDSPTEFQFLGLGVFGTAPLDVRWDSRPQSPAFSALQNTVLCDHPLQHFYLSIDDRVLWVLLS